jgi:hypothetical protein
MKESCDSVGKLAKGKTAKDIAIHHKVPLAKIQKALDAGVKVEMEHTSKREVAYNIAKDHVWEDPNYYSKLKTVEEDAPINNVGGGNMAGVSPGEVPPIRRVNKDRLKRFRTFVFNRGSIGGQPRPY